MTVTDNAKEQRAQSLLAFGARVRELRRAAGLRQEDLAAMVGMDRIAISQIERGQRDVGASRIAGIAAALEVAPGALFEAQDPREDLA